MWTLIILACAALLWLFKLTFAHDGESGVLVGSDFLIRTTLGLSVLAGVLLLQRLLGHLLRGNPSNGGKIGGIANGGAGVSITSDLLQAVMTIALYLIATLLYLSWGLGLDIKSVLATSALLTVIIGLALQPTLGHLFGSSSARVTRNDQVA